MSSRQLNSSKNDQFRYLRLYLGSHRNCFLSSVAKDGNDGCTSEMVWYFIGVKYQEINRTLRGRLEIRNFSSGVEKYILTLEEKFRISALPCYNLFFSIVKSHLP